MIESNDKYSWDPVKREENINKRGLDMVKLADLVFADKGITIKPDIRKNYKEDRFNAYGLVEELRICLCFTPRENKIHLITIFKVNKKDWEKNYETNN